VVDDTNVYWGDNQDTFAIGKNTSYFCAALLGVPKNGEAITTIASGLYSVPGIAETATTCTGPTQEQERTAGASCAS
jgi:hypothetical protein